MRDYGLPRKFFKFSRNDKIVSILAHKDYGLPQFLAESCNDKVES